MRVTAAANLRSAYYWLPGISDRQRRVEKEGFSYKLVFQSRGIFLPLTVLFLNRLQTELRQCWLRQFPQSPWASFYSLEPDRVEKHGKYKGIHKRKTSFFLTGILWSNHLYLSVIIRTKRDDEYSTEIEIEIDKYIDNVSHIYTQRNRNTHIFKLM